MLKNWKEQYTNRQEWSTTFSASGKTWMRISLFGQIALIHSSARSEILIDQPHPMEN